MPWHVWQLTLQCKTCCWKWTWVVSDSRGAKSLKFESGSSAAPAVTTLTRLLQKCSVPVVVIKLFEGWLVRFCLMVLWNCSWPRIQSVCLLGEPNTLFLLLKWVNSICSGFLRRIKGGKYAKNPILTDMQPMPQQKISKKALMRENPSAADYEAWGNPFSVNDVESKSFRLGYGMNGNGRFKNPNANRSRGKRRK